MMAVEDEGRRLARIPQSEEIERMSPSNTQGNKDKRDQFIAEARREQELRMKGYREQALKLFSSICARCGREFEGKRLRELTVHHKDHNHDNNPPDGSNWELLCLYCHDNEHSRYSVAEWYEDATPGEEQRSMATYKPFASLEALLKDKK
jgi:5-methylcytosine-specific restriction endonuclease McrA